MTNRDRYSIQEVSELLSRYIRLYLPIPDFDPILVPPEDLERYMFDKVVGLLPIYKSDTDSPFHLFPIALNLGTKAMVIRVWQKTFQNRYWYEITSEIFVQLREATPQQHNIYLNHIYKMVDIEK